MGIDLEESGIQFYEETAALRAQLEALDGKLRMESQKLKKPCEQPAQDAAHSERREQISGVSIGDNIKTLGPNLGIAMKDQDVAATFQKRRLPTKVPRPPEFEGSSTR
eukprot:3657077-Amphidinium_carterae.1